MTTTAEDRSDEATRDPRLRAGTAGEVFRVFLKLGLTSFGGPIAHLGYFHAELVRRRGWISEEGYADLVALAQFLPGPASSQVGFGMGLFRAGPAGAVAAFLAFTLPSAIAMLAFAYGAGLFGDATGRGVIAGLKIVAVAIVAQAVWGMARTLCPDRARATIALGAVLVVVAFAGAGGQVAAIALGAVAGLLLSRGEGPVASGRSGFGVSRRVGLASLCLFLILLLALPLLRTTGDALALLDAFYRSGSLVFGGGHVVLPLLEAEVVQTGWVSADSFLTGYGLAQAMPGPLFAFAAFLGALIPPGGVTGAALALAALFLPGFLLLVGVLPFWDGLRARPAAQALMRGANAAVVGVLGAALYDPVFTSAIHDARSFALGLTCFVLLTVQKAPPWSVVVVGAVGGVLIAG
jgi:chromate transporter